MTREVVEECVAIRVGCYGPWYLSIAALVATHKLKQSGQASGFFCSEVIEGAGMHEEGDTLSAWKTVNKSAAAKEPGCLCG